VDKERRVLSDGDIGVLEMAAHHLKNQLGTSSGAVEAVLAELNNIVAAARAQGQPELGTAGGQL